MYCELFYFLKLSNIISFKQYHKSWIDCPLSIDFPNIIFAGLITWGWYHNFENDPFKINKIWETRFENSILNLYCETPWRISCALVIFIITCLWTPEQIPPTRVACYINVNTELRVFGSWNKFVDIFKYKYKQVITCSLSCLWKKDRRKHNKTFSQCGDSRIFS